METNRKAKKERSVLREADYISFYCKNCGDTKNLENIYSSSEQDQVIYEMCSDKCLKCGSEDNVIYKYSKEEIKKADWQTYMLRLQERIEKNIK